MNALLSWLDNRTGYRATLHGALYERVPGGSRWIYVTGSMLVFAFVTQMVTGLFLWMAYSPGSQNAWESVYYIQNYMTGGWLLRGIHHFMAQAMVVLLPLHLLQVVLCNAYRAPREFNFWTGLVLMLITLGLSLTGYLLPWDQKGYWATKVATNLMTLAPGGQYLQKLVVGGSDYGHLTLTRFFALHAGLLPALLIGFLVLHLTFFRRHGITHIGAERREAQDFWPHQVLKDAVACLLLLVVVLLLVIRFDVAGLVTGDLGDTRQLGAHLSPPADPVEEYKAARPEWYFLFLFQLLKKFKSEFFGAIVLPSLALGYLFLMPFIGKWKVGHILNCVVLIALVTGSVWLTVEAVQEDYYAQFNEFEPDKYEEGTDEHAQYLDRYKASQDFLAAVEQGHREYERVKELIAFYGIPREGAVALQQNDPETQGPRLFARNCASCHSYLNDEGEGIAGPKPSEDGTPNGAPNLYNFASREWLRPFLTPEGIVSHEYFGNTAHAQKDEDGYYPSGRMVEYVVDTLVDLSDDDKKALDNIAIALSHEAGLDYQQEADQQAEKDGTLAAGRDALINNMGCVDCHKFGDEGDIGVAPDLTGYGSAEWLRRMIATPAHENLYGYETEEGIGNDRMPAFAEFPDQPDQNLLSDHEIEMLVRWLRGDDRELGDEQDSSAESSAGEGDSEAEGDAAAGDESTADNGADESTADESGADESGADESGADDNS